ncbi:MAG: tRNA preQ1(34) S-adenosylmethionine ribosyltransferase-isomerase QueA [Mogibacterium sp.]|nr:tRNA preQ1(34) S-adenosylmethionine ribosyltransferase-isomerase QueA [Mogibacterium sp.]
MLLNDFDYDLPKDLIAQTPAEKRDECRLMVLDMDRGTIEHRFFYDIKQYLRPGDCLVMNDSRVIPARMYGLKASTGARIEMLLIKRLDGDIWECMVRPGKRLHEGDEVLFGGGTDEDGTPDGTFILKAVILGYHDRDNGTREVHFEYEGVFMERLEEVGSMPLPPYIERPAEDADKEMYQTVYSKVDGSVAAPTAGLHFTSELLDEIRAMGIETAYVTLHVGIGTFRPVKVDRIEDHKMHFEEYTVKTEDADVINRTIEQGGRIISVGTTSTRTLESAAVWTDDGYRIATGSSSTGIFIYPGYQFKIVDSLITNFHLPKSTLLMLISALYDREQILAAYKVAVGERYRFFSYGDAMFIKSETSRRHDKEPV